MEPRLIALNSLLSKNKGENKLQAGGDTCHLKMITHNCILLKKYAILDFAHTRSKSVAVSLKLMMNFTTISVIPVKKYLPPEDKNSYIKLFATFIHHSNTY